MVNESNAATVSDYEMFIIGPPPGKPNVLTGFGIGLLGAGTIFMVQGGISPSYSFSQFAFTIGGIMLAAGTSMGTVAIVRWSILNKWNTPFSAAVLPGKAGVIIVCDF